MIIIFDNGLSRKMLYSNWTESSELSLMKFLQSVVPEIKLNIFPTLDHLSITNLTWKMLALVFGPYGGISKY